MLRVYTLRVTRARVRLNNRALKGVRSYCSTNSPRERNEKMPHLGCFLNVNYSSRNGNAACIRLRATPTTPGNPARANRASLLFPRIFAGNDSGRDRASPETLFLQLGGDVVVGRASCKLVVNRVLRTLLMFCL